MDTFFYYQQIGGQGDSKIKVKTLFEQLCSLNYHVHQNIYQLYFTWFKEQKTSLGIQTKQRVYTKLETADIADLILQYFSRFIPLNYFLIEIVVVKDIKTFHPCFTAPIKSTQSKKKAVIDFHTIPFPITSPRKINSNPLIIILTPFLSGRVRRIFRKVGI